MINFLFDKQTIKGSIKVKGIHNILRLIFGLANAIKKYLGLKIT